MAWCGCGDPCCPGREECWRKKGQDDVLLGRNPPVIMPNDYEFQKAYQNGRESFNTSKPNLFNFFNKKD